MTMPSLDTPPPPPRRKTRVFDYIGRMIALSLIVGIAAPAAGIVGLFSPGPLTQEKTVIIPRGTSVADIDRQLSAEGAIYLSPLFRLAAKIVAGNTLKAGEYAIPAQSSPIDIAMMMHEGRSVMRLFTVPEGLTSAEIVKLLNDNTALTGTIDGLPEEGSLLPESYRYNYGDSRAAVVSRMQRAMRDTLLELWTTREPGLPLVSPKQAVALASVVEKETGKAEERPRIAGVFYNRLRAKMRLQSDPTVIYAMTRGKGELGRALTHDDLDYASPYNTYAADGIPPGPICNPGRASLAAVMKPEHHGFLYFVADGSGGHAFADDLDGHNANVARWRKFQSENKK